LAVALQEYEGAVVLVSHDRHLLRVVADELLLVHAGGVTPFDGDLEDYARWLATGSDSQPASAGAGAGAASAEAGAGAAGAEAKAGTRGTPEARKKRKRAQATLRAALGPLRLAVAEQERELERLLATRSQIEQQLALPAASAEGDRKRLKELMQQQVELNQVIQGVESAWMEAAARLEALAAQQQGVD
jgi:ATP-binding cassette subfamily F protein 3